MTLPLGDIPTTKSERWKYTNLPRALRNLTLSPASLGWGKDVAILKPEAPGETQYRDTGLWALNGRHLSDIRFLSGDAELAVDASDGQWLSPRVVIDVKDGETVTIIERHSGSGGYWKNMVVQARVGNNARLRHYRLIDEAAGGVATIFTHVQIGRDATYDAFTLVEGGGTVRNQIHAEIEGENAQCLLRGVNLLRGEQVGDTTITIEHQAPHCHSNQTYKSVIDGSARGVFQGKVHVHQAAQKTDGYQLSNALLLSPLAEMDTKPELEIYADDVKCSHGATTGKLDDAPLFYLRARGIPEAEARALLIEAFCGQAVDDIVDEALRDEVRERIGRWLTSRP